MKNLKTISFLMIGALFMIACENSDLGTKNNLDSEPDELVKQEEGFKSLTDNEDIDLETPFDATFPVLEMHFEGNFNKEYATLEFDKAVEDYFENLPKAKSLGEEAFSTEWYSIIYTYTGNQINNATDNAVGAYLSYTTSAGAYLAPFIYLNDSGNDREGGWDAYLIRTEIPNQAVEWVEVDYGYIYLQGTDGWFITDFIVQLVTSEQSVAATGFSQFWSNPNIWLDNTTDNGWDNYYTGNIGTGRLNF